MTSIGRVRLDRVSGMAGRNLNGQPLMKMGAWFLAVQSVGRPVPPGIRQAGSVVGVANVKRHGHQVGQGIFWEVEPTPALRDITALVADLGQPKGITEDLVEVRTDQWVVQVSWQAGLYVVDAGAFDHPDAAANPRVGAASGWSNRMGHLDLEGEVAITTGGIEDGYPRRLLVSADEAVATLRELIGTGQIDVTADHWITD